MVENSIHETPDGSHPDKPATAFTPLLTTHDWNEEWKELQKARRAADDASHWDKRAATFGSKDAPNPYVERFLDLERDVLCSVDCARSVIAPGGSCVCREASIAHMRQLGTVVYLELSLPEVERRIHNLATRGIALSPGQTIADVYAYRTPLYERCAHLTVPAGGQSLSETVEAVKTALARRNQR